MLRLAIKTGWTIEYIESLPVTILNELKALNVLHPFIGVEEKLLSFIGTCIYNQKATKREHLKSEAQLFPWANQKEKFEDDLVKKAKDLIKSVSGISLLGIDAHQKAIEEIRLKIREEIQIQRKNITPANAKTIRYRIRELSKLLG